MAEQQQREPKATSVDSPVRPCPLAAIKRRIEVLICDDAGRPQHDVAVELRRNDAEALRSITGPDGIVSFEGLEEASYSLSLYCIDSSLWKLLGSEPILPLRSHQAQWQAITKPDPVPGFVHSVEQGECSRKLAERFGISVEKIWNDEHNHELAERHRRANVLNPGDELYIPERTVAYVDTVVDRRYRIAYNGGMDLVRLRFLDLDRTPRAGVPYLLKLTVGGGLAAEDRLGKTDPDGIIEELVPRSLRQAELQLGEPDDRNEYLLEIGHLDPATTLSGIQGRLNHLGYHCGGESGVLGPATRIAIEAFQIDRGLEITGVPDDDTRAALEAVHQS